MKERKKERFFQYWLGEEIKSFKYTCIGVNLLKEVILKNVHMKLIVWLKQTESGL